LKHSIDHLSARDVARKAKRILPLMGRLMEANMRVPALPLPPIHFHVLNRVQVQPYTLTDLADVMSVSAASLSRTITVMEERGWVTRIRSGDDRRLVEISITPEGHLVLTEIEQRSEDFLTETLEKLNTDDLEKLMQGLDIMIGAFSEKMTMLPSDSEVP
jgi:DNA-binding MarR family transcriptional regulator